MTLRKLHPAEYRTWVGMRSRCSNPNGPQWLNYGGRGIKVCKTWDRSFERFLRDMGPRPSSTHSLDRINNNGNYSRKNCRWATQIEQGRNRYNNHVITYLGQTKTIKEWADAIGMNIHRIKQRLVSGWPPELILTAPRYFQVGDKRIGMWPKEMHRDPARIARMRKKRRKEYEASPAYQEWLKRFNEM